MQERIESASEFVVASGEPAKLLEAIEESLHEIARLVSIPVKFARREAIAARWETASAPIVVMVSTKALLSYPLSATTASATKDSTRAGPWVMSATCPPVRVNRIGLPRASTQAWILVVSPPRDRPIA